MCTYKTSYSTVTNGVGVWSGNDTFGVYINHSMRPQMFLQYIIIIKLTLAHRTFAVGVV